MPNNRDLRDRARAVLPGGVNSPVRAFSAVSGEPPFLAHGRGAYATDVDGNRYIDYVMSWGPLILGHGRQEVVEAVREAAGRGLGFGACHEDEVRLAELVRERMPHVEKLRLVTSGTEAAMSALRLARAATGRDHVVKFEGCYHGHADAFLIAAGSGALTFGKPSSPGVPPGAAADTLVAQYNDLASVEALFAEHGASIAAVFVEPVAGNMGVVPPADGFLQGLRAHCDRHGALLVFDEVMTGFRVHPGGAAARYGVTPDLTVLGKVLGGGLPVGAFGGRADLMAQLAPEGAVYQAGTLSGNPLACAAGLATLRALGEGGAYEALEASAARLEEGWRRIFASGDAPWCLNRVGSMLTVFHGVESVTTFADAARADTNAFARRHAAALAEGLYLAPSQYEAAFVSTAHDAAVIDETLERTERALGRLP